MIVSATTVVIGLIFQDALIAKAFPQPKYWSGRGAAYSQRNSQNELHCVATLFKARHGAVTNEGMKRLFGMGLFAAEEKVEESLNTQAGLTEWSVRVDLKNRVCATLTRWLDKEAVSRFRESNKTHGWAMRHSSEWVQPGTARVATWSILLKTPAEGADGFTDGDWQEAMSILEERGEIRY